MLCKKTSKNQITLPKRIAKRFPGIEYFDASIDGEKIVLKPMRLEEIGNPILDSVRDKIAALGITEKELEQAIRSARERKDP